MHALRPLLIAALALPGASAPPNGFEVRVNEGLVTIDAREAPLSDVLDQLGRQTGMKLVYETSRPRQIVSAFIEGVPPPVALTRLLEGLGVGYGFSLDRTGTRVETLLISGVAGTASASLTRPAAPAARLGANGGRLEAEIEALEQPEQEEAPELPTPPEQEATVAPAISLPGLAGMPNIPGMPNLPGMPNVPGSAGGGQGQGSFSPFSGPAMRSPPSFPGGASGPMPWLPPPQIPGVASGPQPQQ